MHWHKAARAQLTKILIANSNRRCAAARKLRVGAWASILEAGLTFARAQTLTSDLLFNCFRLQTAAIL